MKESNKKINEQDYELIQRYHSYELSDEERKSVFERMKTDSTFKYHLHNFGLYQEVIDESEDVDKSKTIENWEAILKNQAKEIPLKANNNRSIRYIMAMTGVMVLALIVWGIWGMNETTSMEYALAEYQQVATQKLSSEERGENDASVFKDAAKGYNDGKYSEAIEAFKKIPTTSKMYERTSLWHGKAYMQQEKWGDAISIFKQIDDPTKYINYREDMLWFLALSYVLNEESENAKTILQKLIKENPTKENAKILFEKLK